MNENVANKFDPFAILDEARLQRQVNSITGGGGSALTITDGTTTVDDVAQLTVSGATVSGSSPDATLTISGGGGGNTITLTADTDIAAGTAVAINSSGHAVQTWGPAPNIPGVVTPIPYSALTNGSVGNNLVGAVTSQDATHFLAWVQAVNNIAPISAVAACSVSGETITCGTPATTTGMSIYNVVALSNSLFVALGAVSPVDVLAGSISSLAITLGSVTSTGLTGANSVITALNSTTFVVFMGASSSNLAAGTVSGTTISMGSPVNVGSGGVSSNSIAIAALSSTSFVAVFADGSNSNALTFIVGTVSGNTVTLGTPVALPNSAASSNITIAALSSTSFVCEFNNIVASNDTEAVVGTVSGTTITLGSSIVLSHFYIPVSLNAGDAVFINSFPIAVIDATHVAFGAGPSLPQVYSVSGTTLSGPSIINLTSATASIKPQVAAGNVVGPGTIAGEYIINGLVAAGSTLVAVDDSSNVYEIDQASSTVSPSIQHAGLTNYGLNPLTSTGVVAWFFDFSGNFQARIIAVEPITPSGPVAFASAAVTSGNSGTFTTSGTCTGFSGLTAGASYYVNGDGTLTTGNTGHLAGVALSATELLIAA